MRFNKIIAPIIAITLLSGCTNGLLGMGNDQNSTTYEQCTRLKRQIIFFKNDPNHNFQWDSPTAQASLINDYQRLNCDDVLAHHNDVPSKQSPLSSGWKRTS